MVGEESGDGAPVQTAPHRRLFFKRMNRNLIGKQGIGQGFDEAGTVDISLRLLPSWRDGWPYICYQRLFNRSKRC